MVSCVKRYSDLIYNGGIPARVESMTGGTQRWRVVRIRGLQRQVVL